MNVVVAPIVEGHAEQVNGNLNSLLCRLWQQHLGIDYPPLIVLRASRGSKATLVDPDRHADLRQRIGEANHRLQEKLAALGGGIGTVMLILDGDEDCMKLDKVREKQPETPKLGPKLVTAAQQQCPHIPDFACVVAVKEFENWLVAGAKGFVGKPGLQLPADFDIPDRPDELTGAGWFAKQRKALSKSLTYRKVQDALHFIRAMDFGEAERLSRSFQKLCKELRKLHSRAVELQSSPPPSEEPAPSPAE